jgi:riboflavin synthase
MKMIITNVGPLYMLEGSIKTLRKYYPGELYVHQNEVDDEEEYRKVFESFLDRHQFKNVNLLTTSKKFNIEFYKT